MILSPAIADPVIEVMFNSVGARMMTRVHDSSPSRPVVPLIPANCAVIVIGPGALMTSTDRTVFIEPLTSVVPRHSNKPSTYISTGTESTGCPALSISEMLTLMTSPRMVLLSGSRSEGSKMDSSEYPRLSKVPFPVLEP